MYFKKHPCQRSHGRISRLKRKLGLYFGIRTSLARHLLLTFFSKEGGLFYDYNFFGITQEEKGKLFYSSLFQIGFWSWPRSRLSCCGMAPLCDRPPWSLFETGSLLPLPSPTPRQLLWPFAGETRTSAKLFFQSLCNWRLCFQKICSLEVHWTYLSKTNISPTLFHYIIYIKSF